MMSKDISIKCDCIEKLKAIIERLVSTYELTEMDTSFEEDIYRGGFHDAMDIVDNAIKEFHE